MRQTYNCPDWTVTHARAAMSYQYAADNFRKYGPRPFSRLSPETVDLRALSCWGAAIKRGLVTG